MIAEEKNVHPITKRRRFKHIRVTIWLSTIIIQTPITKYSTVKHAFECSLLLHALKV